MKSKELREKAERIKAQKREYARKRSVKDKEEGIVTLKLRVDETLASMLRVAVINANKDGLEVRGLVLFNKKDLETHDGFYVNVNANYENEGWHYELMDVIPEKRAVGDFDNKHLIKVMRKLHIKHI